jgi:DNA processing protein
LIDPRRYYIAFSLVKGIGAVRFRCLLDHFGQADIAWNASAEALHQAGLSNKIIQNLLEVRSKISLDKVWERIQNLGIKVITWEDECYPRRLLEIDQPPPLLYVRGEILPEDLWSVAIVGTRRVSAYGRQIAEEVAVTLARNGITVISGLARGVDAIAHQAAINAGGRSIAIMGNGVDRIYPPENRKLAEQIISKGALVSDYPPGTPPEASNFPPRNRIISGLSLAVVVIEAGDTSGALITASFAADQGREVFAVPGNITSPQSKGTNRLIYNGAIPLLDPREVLEVLQLTMVSQHQEARVVLPSDALEAQLYAALENEPLHVDEIRARTNLPIEQVTSTLALMELKGMVRQVGGMQYVVLRENKNVYQVDEVDDVET